MGHLPDDGNGETPQPSYAVAVVLNTCEVKKGPLGVTVTRFYGTGNDRGFLYQQKESFWGPTAEAAATALLKLRGTQARA